MSTSEQSYIQQWLNTIYPSLVQQLPTLLTNGGFEPYGGPDKTGFVWDVGTVTGDAGQNAATIVCGRVGLAQWPQQVWIPFPSSGLPSINLTASFVAGLSRISLPPYNSGNPAASGFYAPLDQDRVIIINGTFTDILNLKGNFSFYQNCCQSADNTTCQPGVTEQNLQAQGTYQATIQQASVQITLQITTLETNNLVVAASSVVMNLAPTTDNIKITVNITSVSDGHVEDYDQSADQLFNQDATISTIVSSLQSTLQQPHNLAVFGQEMTQQLDTYLSQNHYYPYGPPFLGLV